MLLLLFSGEVGVDRAREEEEEEGAEEDEEEDDDVRAAILTEGT